MTSSAVFVLAVSTGVVVIVVAVCIVLVVLLITLSLRGRRTDSAHRRDDARRDLEAAHDSGARDAPERAVDDGPERPS